jgi:thioredoxin-like negative regulator of GroEL
MFEDNTDFSWMFVDTINDPADLAQKFGVQYVPTMVTLYHNQEVGRYSGSQAMGYYHLLKNLRNNCA